MSTSFLAYFLVIVPEQTSNITTHIKHSCVLLIKTRALITYAIIHQVVVSIVELSLEVCAAHTILLRKVGMVIVRLAWCSMQIFIAPFVSSRNWHRCLIMVYILTLSAILHVRPQISNAWSSAASYDPFSLIRLARLLMRTKILVIFK